MRLVLECILNAAHWRVAALTSVSICSNPALLIGWVVMVDAQPQRSRQPQRVAVVIKGVPVSGYSAHDNDAALWPVVVSSSLRSQFQQLAVSHFSPPSTRRAWSMAALIWSL